MEIPGNIEPKEREGVLRIRIKLPREEFRNAGADDLKQLHERLIGYLDKPAMVVWDLTD